MKILTYSMSRSYIPRAVWPCWSKFAQSFLATLVIFGGQKLGKLWVFPFQFLLNMGIKPIKDSRSKSSLDISLSASKSSKICQKFSKIYNNVFVLALITLEFMVNQNIRLRPNKQAWIIYKELDRINERLN